MASWLTAPCACTCMVSNPPHTMSLADDASGWCVAYSTRRHTTQQRRCVAHECADAPRTQGQGHARLSFRGRVGGKGAAATNPVSPSAASPLLAPLSPSVTHAATGRPCCAPCACRFLCPCCRRPCRAPSACRCLCLCSRPCRCPCRRPCRHPCRSHACVARSGLAAHVLSWGSRCGARPRLK